MAAILPALFENRDEQLDATANLLGQRIDAKIRAVVRLPQMVSDHTAQMTSLLASTDAADKPEERSAYRTKLRRVWRKQCKQPVIDFLANEAVEQNQSVADLMRDILTALAATETDPATSQPKTLAVLLAEIGA